MSHWGGKPSASKRPQGAGRKTVGIAAKQEKRRVMILKKRGIKDQGHKVQ